MKQNRRAVLGALLVVVAFGLTAATLTNPTESSAGSGSGTGPEVGSGIDSEPAQGGTSNQTASGGVLPIVGGGTCVPFLITGEFLVLAAVALLLVGLLVRRRTNTFIAVVVLAAFVAPLTVLYGPLTRCGDPIDTSVDDIASVNVSNQTPPMTGSGSGGGGEVATSPPVVLAVVILVAVLLFLLAVRGSGDDETEDPKQDEESGDALGDIADTAGTAADRIEAATDLENAVYQAWWEMTTHLDIDSPETTTPAEFAATAREAGMQPEHVDTLTDLFREVRYGGQPVTDQREQRALDALRDIESAYGKDDT